MVKTEELRKESDLGELREQRKVEKIRENASIFKP